MLIDETFFKGNLYIANVDEPDPDNLLYTDLKSFIERSEEEVLSFAFGVKMWLDFKERYKADPENLPENYKAILNGKHYTKIYNGEPKDLYWKGLVQREEKESLLAYHVYVSYQNNNVTQTTAFGQTKVDNKIGVQVPITPKVTRIHNEFLEMLHGGIRTDRSGLTYEGNPYWDLGRGIDYFGIYNRSGFVSLMQFLLDNAQDYPLLEFNYSKFGTLQNDFGL